MRKEYCKMIILALIVATIGCDPQFPTGNLKVVVKKKMQVGDTVELTVIYPDTGGTPVHGWKDQRVDIVEGEDIVYVDGLTITALKPGIVKIVVKANTMDEFDEFEGTVFSSKEVKITVK